VRLPPGLVRIWRIPFSTNVERVALALGHKGLAADWVDVDPADRGEVERLSGQPLVPVLELDGRVLVDSTAIIQELERLQPDPRLYPSDPARRAEVEVFVDWFDRVWKRPPNDLEAELSKAEPDPAEVERLGSEIAGALPRFEALLDGRDYLFGDFGVADCIAFPFLKYAVLYDPADEELFHRILVEHQPLDDRYPRLDAWIRRVDERPRA
jgi:glutathione S-transferase